MIRSDRRITFGAPPAEVWEALTRTGMYTAWWPWLRRLDAVGLVAEDVWSCHVQPPLPYSLRFTITLDEVVDGRSVRATVAGEIVGSARVELLPAGPAATVVHFVSDLAPAAGALRAFAAVARPLVAWGHDWVIDQGIRQFRGRALGAP